MKIPVNESFITVGGHSVAVRYVGDPANQPAYTILALHGFTGSGEDFGPLQEALGRRDVHWLCPDFPGHGESDSPQNIDPYRLLPAIGLIDRVRRMARHPNKVLMLGYSMGGRLALQYLKWAQPLPAVLIGASPGIEDPAERARRRLRDSNLIDPGKTQLDDFCQRWEEQPLILPQTRLPEPLRRELADRRRRNSLTGLANSLAGCGAGALPSLWADLPHLPPVTCLYGEKDRKFAEIARRMQKANATLSTAGIPGAGHAPHLESPGALAVLLNNRLEDT